MNIKTILALVCLCLINLNEISAINPFIFLHNNSILFKSYSNFKKDSPHKPGSSTQTPLEEKKPIQPSEQQASINLQNSKKVDGNQIYIYRDAPTKQEPQKSTESEPQKSTESEPQKISEENLPENSQENISVHAEQKKPQEEMDQQQQNTLKFN